VRAVGATRTLRLTCALVCSASFSGLLSQPARAELPPIKHVFVIVLENEAESASFGATSTAPYLAKTLPSEGAFIPNYYGIGHNSLDNYIAMISGQAPNPQTQADCISKYSAIPEVNLEEGQEPEPGCVYPNNVPTLPGQLEEHGLTWRSYDESMGLNKTRDGGVACAHPEIGQPDGAVGVETTPPYDAYATRHDPFVYFNSITSNDGECKAHVVNLIQLPTDLEKESTTRHYSYITPDLCDDGHEGSCPNGRPGGLPAINKFLETWVPKITASEAFINNGLLIITFDEGEDDSSSCCGEKPGPASEHPGAGQPGPGTGGGDIGAVLLSPYIAPCTVSSVAYNHYSMLGSIEDLFELPPLGYAKGTTAFGSDIFTKYPSLVSPAPTCYVPPVTQPQPKETPVVAKSTTTTPAPVCVATVLARNPRGKLKANKVFTGVAVQHSGSVASLSLTAVHTGRLKIIAYPKKGRARTLTSSRKLATCTPYTFKLPSGHGRLTIVATVGRASQTTTLKY
jgi:hypothetical protein